MSAIEALDHVVLAVPDLDAAAERFRALGLVLSQRGTHQGRGTANHAIFFHAAEGEFYVELLTATDREAAAATGAQSLLDKLDAGGGLLRLMLRTSDLAAVRASLDAAGTAHTTDVVQREDGSLICEVLRPVGDAAGCEVAIVQYPETIEERTARHRGHGLFDHTLALQRADHVAILVKDLEATSKFWNEVLGLATVGEIPTPMMTIRQILAGDVMVELLAAASPDSPMASRPGGLASMVAFEVPDMDAAIKVVRERGFTAPDSETGVIPGTIRSSIPATEVAGLGVQLIAYVHPPA